MLVGFSEDFGKRVMLPGSEIFSIGTGWSGDFQSQFLFNQMQKVDATSGQGRENNTL